MKRDYDETKMKELEQISVTTYNITSNAMMTTRLLNGLRIWVGGACIKKGVRGWQIRACRSVFDKDYK
ncbi:hypothetical protein Bca4012_075529 [Brassica carinata]